MEHDYDKHPPSPENVNMMSKAALIPYAIHFKLIKNKSAARDITAEVLREMCVKHAKTLEEGPPESESKPEGGIERATDALNDIQPSDVTVTDKVVYGDEVLEDAWPYGGEPKPAKSADRIYRDHAGREVTPKAVRVTEVPRPDGEPQPMEGDRPRERRPRVSKPEPLPKRVLEQNRARRRAKNKDKRKQRAKSKR